MVSRSALVRFGTPPALYPASISGRKLLDQNGNVYLAKVFSSWSLASHLSNANITVALEDVAENHFNGVSVWCGGTEDRGTTGWDKYTNLAAQNFWTGTPWASSLGAAWASVDWVVQECARLGLVLHFSFCHGWGSPTPYGCAPDWNAVTNTNMHDAGVAIATRYAAYPNIVWHVMFDDPLAVTDTAGVRIRNLFNGINATEGASTRPVRWCETNQPSSTFSQGWYDPTGASTDTRFSVNCLYSWANTAVTVTEGAYGEVSGPVGDCEPVYVGNTDAYGGSRQQLRERSYSVFLEGGSLLNWGHEDWWPFGAAQLFSAGETWDTVVSDDETVDARYCWDLIDVYCKDATYAPTSAFVTTGAGVGDVKAAVGASNTAALAYFPDNRTVVVDTTIIAGTGNVRLRWYDPTAGTFSTIAASEAQNASRSVTLPAAHADTSRDFVLVVDGG